MMNFRYLKYLIIIFLVFSIAQPVLNAPNKKSNFLYNEGLKKYIYKDYKGAINDFEKAYKIDKNNIKIFKIYLKTLKKQADIEYKNENVESAEIYYQKALSLVKEKSQELTQKAIKEIDRKRFEKARKFLKEALSLYPENSRAKEIYSTLIEIDGIENEDVDRVTDYLIDKRKNNIIKLSFSYMMADSNYLDNINSKVSMIGIGFDGRYYFDFLKKMLGLSIDYRSYPLKITGDDDISFIAYKLNASLRFRMFFFEDLSNCLIVGLRFNYHFFYLHNLKDQGAYYFTKIYAPSFGIFFSDPVVHRFYKNKYLRDFGLEGEFNYLKVTGDAPMHIDSYLGAYYNIGHFRYGAGFRFYMIKQNSIKEIYKDIEVSAGYSFF